MEYLEHSQDQLAEIRRQIEALKSTSPLMTVDIPQQSTHREYLMAHRQALLMELDALERYLGLTPRTAELRKQAKG